MNKEKMIEDILGSNDTMITKQLATLEQLLIQKGTITENEFNETYKIVSEFFDKLLLDKVEKMEVECERD